MKNKNLCSKALLVALLLFLIVFNSCKKNGQSDYGCMDPNALNYNPAAIHEDGSCMYNGSIVLWKNIPGATVTVKLPDGSTGYITKTLTTAPLCNADGCLTYTNKPGSYSFSASDGVR